MTHPHADLCARLRRTDKHGYPSCYVCEEAAAALEADAKDAERYRWLRTLEADPCIAFRRDVRASVPFHWADAAIDVAREGKP